MADGDQAELERLRAENARLRSSVAGSVPETSGGRVWRAWVSALCLVLAGILVPLSIAGGWARAQLVDESSFVQTFAPLAEDPDVQDFLIDQATTAVEENVDIDGLTADLFDGLATLDLPPRALTALGLLEGPAAQGAHSLIASTVETTIQSDAFPTVWRTTLVASHRALVSAATLDENGTLVLDETGGLGINLGPVVEEVKKRLTDQGFGLASSIPTVNRVVVVAQADGLLLLAAVYAIADALGVLLPWVTLGLLVAGVTVARRRTRGVLGAGLAVALGAGALAAGIVGGGVLLRMASPSWGVPPATMTAVFDAVAGAMRDTAWALTTLGVLIAVSGWLGGRSRAARRLRGLGASLARGARGTLQSYGMDTGRFGVWLYRQRVLVGVLLVLGGLAVLMALRPVSLGDVVAVVGAGLGLQLVATLLQRVDGEAPAPVGPVAHADDVVAADPGA